MTQDNEYAKFLWVGSPIGWIQELCIQSAVKNNFVVELFTDRPAETALEGVQIFDYRDVFDDVDPVALKRRGIPYAAFADVFRYKLLGQSDGWWFDTDTLVMKSAAHFCALRQRYENVFGLQPGGKIANGVIWSSNRLRMERLAEAALPDLFKPVYIWGSTGPLLVSEVVPSWSCTRIVPPNIFYGIPFGGSPRIWNDDASNVMEEMTDDALALSL